MYNANHTTETHPHTDARMHSPIRDFKLILFVVYVQEHIGDIFRSKFSDFNNFHTMLYTCAPEFDFLAAEVSNERVTVI